MRFRTSVAQSYGEPDPYAPLPPPGKDPQMSWWARSELRHVPIYEGMVRVFLVAGVVCLLVAGIVELAHLA